MITGELKNKIDKIWTDIWAGGITNPITVIEQLTYLIFIRSLDVKEQQTEKDKSVAALLGAPTEAKIFPQTEEGQKMRWSRFKDLDPRDIFTIVSQQVFPFIKTLSGGEETAFSRYMSDAMFLIPTPQVLQKIITGLDDLYATAAAQGKDMQGDIYEYMLDKLQTSGKNGQFRTPLHIRQMMVQLIDPKPGEYICDPACGTAGFLISSAEYIPEKHRSEYMKAENLEHYRTKAFTGFDTDRTMLRISAMNLMLHGITDPEIDYKDSISKQNDICDKYDVILANPPFKGTVDAESINDDLKTIANTKKTELLFIALFVRMLKIGGRCACIVPDGVLFGSSKAHKAIRRELVENQQLQAVISMPSGVFKPYAGVSTAVLVFTKTNSGGTDKVWFYDMHADGLSLDDKRSEIKENDIPDILARFAKLEEETDRKRTEQSFLVPKQEIIDNDYDLSINKYKEIEYIPEEYPPTEEILAELKDMEKQIADGLNELEKMLK